MNFKQLEYVLSIYREGSLSRAAEKLYISQPALTQQLKKLEKEIGAPLFDRSTTPLKPTYAGQHYLEIIEKMLYENDQALKWLEDIHVLNQGHILLGIPPIRSIQFLPVLLPSFHEKYPNIKVEIKEAPALALAEMVMKGEIDFALMIVHTDNHKMIFRPILKEHVMLALPPDSPLNECCRDSIEKNGFLDLSILKDEPFILLKKGHRLRKIAYDLFEQNHMMPSIILETENIDLAHHMVAAGYGATLLGEIAAVLNTFSPCPCYYPVKGENCEWELGIAWHPDKYISKAMLAFFDHVTAVLSELEMG
ncbi:MAG: LysR family transcriptional regulator [Clostridiales bacterium]|nr:LysR family transcriptional regulator [Clostridiales bacterium]